jgi:hypothetical protein
MRCSQGSPRAHCNARLPDQAKVRSGLVGVGFERSLNFDGGCEGEFILNSGAVVCFSPHHRITCPRASIWRNREGRSAPSFEIDMGSPKGIG